MIDDISKHRKLPVSVWYGPTTQCMRSIRLIPTGVPSPLKLESTSTILKRTPRETARHWHLKITNHYKIRYHLSYPRSSTFQKNDFRKNREFKSLFWGFLCAYAIVWFTMLTRRANTARSEHTTQSIFIYKPGRLVKFYVRLRMDCNVPPHIILQNNSQNKSGLKTWVLLPKILLSYMK